MPIVTAGRTDLSDFFRISGDLSGPAAAPAFFALVIRLELGGRGGAHHLRARLRPECHRTSAPMSANGRDISTARGSVSDR